MNDTFVSFAQKSAELVLTYLSPRKWRICLIVTLIAVMSFLFRHFKLDDALIYARYVQNAIDGKGLVYNPGEPVNALTSVLNTWLVLALAALLKGHVLLVEVGLSTLFLFLAALLAEITVPFAGILLVTCPFFYCCTGMETTLFVFVLMLCVCAYAAGKVNWLPLLCVLAILTRFEGGALAAIIAWRLWQTRRMPAITAFLAPGALIAFYLIFNFSFYHHLLPQSATAKLGQGISGFWGKWPTAFFFVPDGVGFPIGTSYVYFVILAVLAWFAAKDQRFTFWNQIVPPFLIILATFYIFFNIPGYGWYYAPFVYFLTIYALHLLPHRKDTWFAAAIIFLSIFRTSGVYLHQADKRPQTYDDVGRWIDQHTPRDAHIATVETGHIGWYCHRYVTDIVGLTTPRNATYTAHADWTSWFNERPDYIVVHLDLDFPWERVALASSEYERLPVHWDGVYLLHRKNAPPLAVP